MISRVWRLSFHVVIEVFLSFYLQSCESKSLATNVLVFMVVGVHNEVKEAVAHFATTTAKSDFLYRKVWESVAYLEMQDMKVIV